jgi:hypothetical protein
MDNGGNTWRRIVGDGEIVAARATAFSKMALALGLAVIASAGFDVWSNAAPALSRSARDDAAGVIEARVPNPREMEAWRASALSRNGRQDAAFGATPVAEFEGFVAEIEREPGLLDSKYSCFATDTLSKPWVDPATGRASRPVCRKSPDGKVVWVATYVLEGSSSKPVIGIVRTTERGSKYVNFAMSLGIGRTYQVRGKDAVTPEMIAYRMEEDFPGSTVVGNPEPGKAEAKEKAKEKSASVAARVKDWWGDKRSKK